MLHRKAATVPMVVHSFSSFSPTCEHIPWWKHRTSEWQRGDSGVKNTVWNMHFFGNTICHWILLILSPFRVLGSPFWLNLEALGTLLAPFWWSSGTQMRSKQPWKVPGWILDYFWWILGPPSDTILDNFLIFSVIGIVKKYVWIVGMTFIDCWMVNLLISDVPTYQLIF